MRTFWVLAAVCMAATFGLAQDTVTLTIHGTGSDLVEDTSFQFFGQANITGLETAVLTGTGLYSGVTQRGGTIVASGTFALVFPSGGSIIGTFSLPIASGVSRAQIG